MANDTTCVNASSYLGIGLQFAKLIYSAINLSLIQSHLLQKSPQATASARTSAPLSEQSDSSATLLRPLC